MTSAAGNSWWHSYLRHPVHGPLPAILLALTVVTGFDDALSILGLGRVFVANMTGNVVFIGFALAHAPGFGLLGSLVAFLGFVVGATASGPLVARFGRRRSGLLRSALLAELGLTLVSLILSLSLPTGRTGVQTAILALASLGLGLQNAAVRHLAVPDLTTTVLTMAITGIGADLRKHDSAAALRRALSIFAMLAGAGLGALIVDGAGISATLGVIAVLLLGIVVALTVVSRVPATWQAPVG